MLAAEAKPLVVAHVLDTLSPAVRLVKILGMPRVICLAASCRVVPVLLEVLGERQPRVAGVTAVPVRGRPPKACSIVSLRLDSKPYYRTDSDRQCLLSLKLYVSVVSGRLPDMNELRDGEHTAYCV
jgi:hypothetical protein